MHDQSLSLLKALADPTRLAIVKTVAKKQCKSSCSEVSECSDLSQPAMSHHFKKLVDAGVLTETKIGIEKAYTVNYTLLEAHGINVNKL